MKKFLLFPLIVLLNCASVIQTKGLQDIVVNNAPLSNLQLKSVKKNHTQELDYSLRKLNNCTYIVSERNGTIFENIYTKLDTIPGISLKFSTYGRIYAISFENGEIGIFYGNNTGTFEKGKEVKKGDLIGVLNSNENLYLEKPKDQDTLLCYKILN
ncbi:MAG: hypothetical protein WC755_01545 [Candidatus Woesearchaeota archaeon]